MSLYTDAPILTPASLLAVDPSIQDVSVASKISLSGPNGVIQQAWTELGHELLEWMSSLTGNIYGNVGQIIQSGIYAGNRSRYLLNQVVTTSQFAGILSPLAQYASHQALVLFWKQAVRSSKTADRFEKKLEMAEEDKRQARRRLWVFGIPINLNPLSCPGAQFDPLAGQWSNTNVTAGPHVGTLATETSFDVAVTWVDQTNYTSATQPGNAESGPSQLITVTLQPGQSLFASIGSLFPPGSKPYLGGVADGVYYFRKASGWNLYAGISGMNLVQQNPSPLALTATTFEQTTIALAGNLLTHGQVADFNQRPTHTFSRA